MVIGNLWDVTDKDIDRYLKNVLDNWLDAKNTDKRNLLEIVMTARNTCKMGYLVGAAPVCYGLPIYFSS